MLIETLSRQIDESAMRGEIDGGLWIYIYTHESQEIFELWEECWSDELRVQEFNGYRLSSRRAPLDEFYVKCPSGRVLYFTAHRKSEREIEFDQLQENDIEPLMRCVQDLQFALLRARMLYAHNLLNPLYEQLRKRTQSLECECDVLWHDLRQKLYDLRGC